MTNWWPEKLRKAGLGIIPEDRYAQGLCREMSVSDNCIAGYHGAKDICKRGLYNRKKINEKRDSFIKEFDIRLGDVNGPIGSLSGGNAQKGDHSPRIISTSKGVAGMSANTRCGYWIDRVYP